MDPCEAAAAATKASKPEAAPAMRLLRDLWSADGRSEADLVGAICGGGNTCSSTAELGIKGMEDAGMAHAMREQWKRQLAAEGKTRANGRSIGAEFREQIADGAGY